MKTATTTGTILDPLEKKMNIEIMKYLISKQIFCKLTEKVLDYRNCIMLTTNIEGRENVRVIHGSLQDKIPAFIARMEQMGHTVKVFENITKK